MLPQWLECCCNGIMGGQPLVFLNSRALMKFMMLGFLFTAAGFLDVMDTLNDLSFVIRVIIFSYFLFWLFITFRELPMVFGLSVIGLAYLIFVATIPMFVLAIAFLLFLTPFGMMLQQGIQFGLLPFLGREPMSGRRMPDPEELQRIQEKAMRGENLTQRELELLQEMQAQQQMQEMMGGAMAGRRMPV